MVNKNSNLGQNMQIKWRQGTKKGKKREREWKTFRSHMEALFSAIIFFAEGSLLLLLLLLVCGFLLKLANSHIITQ